MDDQICSLLGDHYSFGFQGMFEKALDLDVFSSSTSPSQRHSPSTFEAPSSRIPNTIPDTGTPDTSTSSLITPIQPGTFIFPPNLSDPVSFPSVDWFSFSTTTPNENINPSHFQAPPIWDEDCAPLPIMSGGNYGVEVNSKPLTDPIFHLGCEGTGTLDPWFYGPSYRPPGEGGFGTDQIEIAQPKGKEKFSAFETI
jgi:hypothetical protein